MKRGENLLKHGLTGTAEHRAWCSMLGRCESSKPGDRNYHLYRGAGVTVCERWHDFVAFLADMGHRPSAKHSLDRFPNPSGNYEPASGNYEPGNVRWATPKEQCNNWRTRNRKITFAGETLPIAEWASRLGIKRESLRDRLATGWAVEKALTMPAVRNRSRGQDGTFAAAGN